MQCGEVRERLSAFVDGEDGGIAGHLASCAACSAARAEMEEENDALDAALAPVGDRAAAAAERALLSLPRESKSLPRGGLVFAAAAAVLLAVVLWRLPTRPAEGSRGPVVLAGRVEEAGAVREPGARLPEQARLKTGKDGSLVLLSGGNRLYVRADSEISLTAKGCRVHRGSVWIDASQPAIVEVGDARISCASGGLLAENTGPGALFETCEAVDAEVLTPGLPLKLGASQVVEVRMVGCSVDPASVKGRPAWVRRLDGKR